MRESIDRILVPIDYTEPSFHAAWIAFAIARSMRASMALIHIHIREEALRELVVMDQSELAEISDEKFNELLLKLVGDPSYHALQATGEHSLIEMATCTYSPSDEICNYAKEKNISLIVIGSRIHSKLEDLILGNVSSEVLRKAPCPVTVVH